MSEFLQLCFNGLALGARYALVALGFVIIYRASPRAGWWRSAPT
jgi:branched-subunit amino acid ABC-type transport system permease component